MKALFSRGLRRISLRLARVVLFTGLSIHPSLQEYWVSEGFIVWEGITSCSCHYPCTKYQQSQNKNAYEQVT